MLVEEGVVSLAGGKTLKYQVDTTAVKGEDEYVICPDLAAALHALAKETDPMPKKRQKVEQLESDTSIEKHDDDDDKKSDGFTDELEKVDLRELGDWVQESFGQISLFAILDGHGGKPTAFTPNVVPAFALELKKALPTEPQCQKLSEDSDNNNKVKDQEAEEKKTRVHQACFHFPRRLHNYVKAAWLKNKKPIDLGSTLSFCVIFHDEMFLGIVGDSPTGAILKDKKHVLVDLQSTTMDDKNVWPNAGISKAGGKDNYYIAYPYCIAPLLVNNAIGDFLFDAELQELFFDFARHEEKREEIAKKYPAIKYFYEKPCPPLATFRGISERPSFLPKPFKFDQRPHLQRVALDTVVGAFIVSDGVFDRYHHGRVRKTLRNWAEWNFKKIRKSFDKVPRSHRDDATSILLKLV